MRETCTSGSTRGRRVADYSVAHRPTLPAHTSDLIQDTLQVHSAQDKHRTAPSQIHMKSCYR